MPDVRPAQLPSEAAMAPSRQAQRTDGPAPAAAVSPRSARVQEAALPDMGGIRIGVIADNHGYLDPEVLALFAGVAHILHAGDIIDPAILAALAVVAPVTAVAGNMDTGEFAAPLPREAAGEACGVRFAQGHKYKRLMKRLADGRIPGLAAGVTPDLVVYGHDHTPAAAWVEGTLFLNPGSASAPHEEDDGPTVAIVSVRPSGLAVSFLPLARRDLDASRT